MEEKSKKHRFARIRWMIFVLFIMVAISVSFQNIMKADRVEYVVTVKAANDKEADDDKKDEKRVQGDSISQREYKEYKAAENRKNQGDVNRFTGSIFAAGNMIIIAMICAIGWFIFLIVFYSRNKKVRTDHE